MVGEDEILLDPFLITEKAMNGSLNVCLVDQERSVCLFLYLRDEVFYLFTYLLCFLVGYVAAHREIVNV